MLVIGGRKHDRDANDMPQAYGCTREAAYSPELWINGEWREMAATHIIRDYHSTALLLPNGKVLVGGGESREWEESPDCVRQDCPPGSCEPGHDRFQRNAIAGPVDYQIYVPPYIEGGGERPEAPEIGFRQVSPGVTRIHLSGAPAGTMAYLLLGASDTIHLGHSLPLLLDSIGLPGCLLYNSIDLVVAVRTGTCGIDRGYAFVDVPRAPFRLHGQWVVAEREGAALRVALSRGLSW